jgi:hypothetical protein
MFEVAKSRENAVGSRHPERDNGIMIRIREIVDPELRERIVGALADRRGVAASAIPSWFELDDLDYVDLLNDLKEQDQENRPEEEWEM